MELKTWTVYVHTNNENNKKYVGITSKPNPEHRWNKGNGYKENTYFHSAIQKYGWDGFSHTILFEGLTNEQAIEKEKLLIKEWNTQDRRYGYNMTSGGEGTPGCHPSDETRQKLSFARRKENLSEETLKRRSESLKGRSFSDEHKRKIGRGNSKPVNMLTKNGEYIKTFPSAREAEIELKISHTHISQCCHSQRITAGGYKWTFA